MKGISTANDVKVTPQKHLNHKQLQTFNIN